MGPCVAYCLCSRVGSVAVAVPAPTILCFAPLSIVTAHLKHTRLMAGRGIPRRLRLLGWQLCPLPPKPPKSGDAIPSSGLCDHEP